MAVSLAFPDPGNSFSLALLTCQRGAIVEIRPNSTQTPIKWTSRGYQTCDAGDMCQETLLLVDIGAWAVQEVWPLLWVPGFPALDSVPAFLPRSLHTWGSKPNSSSFCALLSPFENWEQ